MVEMKFVPDLCSQSRLSQLCANRDLINFKKIVRLVLSVEPSMFAVVKQLSEHQPRYDRMSRTDFQSNKTTHLLQAFLHQNMPP